MFILANVTASPTTPTRSRTRLIFAAVAVTVVVALMVFLVLNGGSPKAEQAPETPTPVVTDTPSTEPAPELAQTPDQTEASPSAPSVVDAALADCTQPTEGFVPNRFTIESLGADEPVIALDLDKDGNIAAPPFDEPRMASWWSGGPKPGDDAGKAVLSIHTYNPSLPPALGNEMYEGGRSQLEAGDVIKLYGPDGEVMCYEYTHDLKVWIDEYDPDSDVMYDFEGDPQLAIIICWDFDPRTRDWDSRILFYGSPVTLAA